MRVGRTLILGLLAVAITVSSQTTDRRRGEQDRQ
jgi:hypothetical protein